MVRQGKLTTIVFVRAINHKGQEVSGYIDYAHRLKLEASIAADSYPPQRDPRGPHHGAASPFPQSFEPYFEQQKKLLPRPSDLSFYNWETQRSTSNATPNFQARRKPTAHPQSAAPARTRPRRPVAGDCRQRSGAALQEQARPQSHKCGPESAAWRQLASDRAAHPRAPTGTPLRPCHQEKIVKRDPMRLPRCWPRGRPRARTAGRCRARRRGCALQTHTQRRGASQTVSRTVYTRNPLSRSTHRPRLRLRQAVSIRLSA